MGFLSNDLMFLDIEVPHEAPMSVNFGDGYVDVLGNFTPGFGFNSRAQNNNENRKPLKFMK